jgi:hypothetical protein
MSTPLLKTRARVFPGGTHAIRNTGPTPLRILVACLET